MGKDERLHQGHRMDAGAMRRRSRWDVYEAMKRSYMYSGHVPTRDEIVRTFAPDTEPLEIEEGIREFVLTLRRFAPELTMAQVIAR